MMWIERGVVYCEDLMEHECCMWAERRVLRVVLGVGTLGSKGLISRPLLVTRIFFAMFRHVCDIYSSAFCGI